MNPKEACIDTPVRVRERHRVAERRGMVGTIVDRYGGEKYIAVDVLLSNGQRRLFWPEDLEEISVPGPSSWWHSLLSRQSAQ